MFGYVRVNHPELKVKEYEFYRGTYCGLCRSMGKCTGQCSRMTLSYDFAFLALLRIAFLNESVSFGQKRCIAHPLKKRNYMKHNPTLRYCAGAAALLNYHKLRDDLADERGWKRFRARLLWSSVAHSRKRALRQGLEELDRIVAAGLEELARTEQTTLESVNLPAQRFGAILGEIVSYGIEGSERRVAYSLGEAVGKWIYIADALDDLDEDEKKGRYNPFIGLYGGRAPTAEERQGIRLALKNELYAAEAAMDLMNVQNDVVNNLIQNILYLGMPEKIDRILCEREQKRQKKTKNGKDGNTDE